MACSQSAELAAQTSGVCSLLHSETVDVEALRHAEQALDSAAVLDASEEAFDHTVEHGAADGELVYYPDSPAGLSPGTTPSAVEAATVACSTEIETATALSEHQPYSADAETAASVANARAQRVAAAGKLAETPEMVSHGIGSVATESAGNNGEYSDHVGSAVALGSSVLLPSVDVAAGTD